MLENNNRNLVFSSSTSSFGKPQVAFICEEHSKELIVLNGRSKLMVEKMLLDICKASDLKVCCFTYFDAAGADASSLIGEAQEAETHLILNALRSIQNAGPGSKIYGSDYITRDGTCVLDDGHVNDLAAAHLLGLEHLDKHSSFSDFNLGNVNGISVLEVLQVCSRVTGQEIPYGISGRRAGDPAQLVADSRKAALSLGWQPLWSDIESTIESAWGWQKQEKSK